MTLDEFTREVRRTKVDECARQLTDVEQRLCWNALGLAGEAGECADHLKKAIFHEGGLNLDTIRKELGDVLWYTTALALDLGLSLNEIMAANVAKLRVRYPDGFSVIAAAARADESQPLLPNLEG